MQSRSFEDLCIAGKAQSALPSVPTRVRLAVWRFKSAWIGLPRPVRGFFMSSDAVTFMPSPSLYLPDPPLCHPEPVFLSKGERDARHPSLVSYLLPTRWACYFINDDSSGLDEDEIAAADAWWVETFSANSASCVDSDEDYGFTRYHDAAGYCLATDCTIYRFLLQAPAPASPSGAPSLGAKP